MSYSKARACARMRLVDGLTRPRQWRAAAATRCCPSIREGGQHPRRPMPYSLRPWTRISAGSCCTRGSRRYSDGDPSSGVAEKKCYRRKRRREDARPVPRDAAPNSRSAYQRFAFTSYGGERGVLHSWLGGGNNMEHQW